MKVTTIDGSQGEGGGQILRTSLSLSLVLGQAVALEKIRANRSKPGLRPQHMAAVEGARRLGMATVEGLSVGSTELTFTPMPRMELTSPGWLGVDVGTAGAASLVLHTMILPAALRYSRYSDLEVHGGTHVPWSPPFSHLSRSWAPMMSRLGVQVELSLMRAGFYPAGGGTIRAKVVPTLETKPLKLVNRPDLSRVVVTSGVANLPLDIADRQASRVRKRLARRSIEAQVEVESYKTKSPGTFVEITAWFGDLPLAFTALGAKGKRGEAVADEAVDAFLEHLDRSGALDPHLADQVLLPLALASGPSRFTTSRVTQHLLTNAWVIESFGIASVEVRGELGGSGSVYVVPLPPQT